MRPAAAELDAWLARALEIARAAGAVLLAHQARLRELRTEFKGRRELVTAADRAAERIVVESLRASFPDHAILAEEGVLTPAGRADTGADLVWIVDPLDGTTNFVHGIPFYCVALSLSWRGEVLLGAVHAPALGRDYAARRGGGATRDGAPIRVSATDDVADALVATGLSYVRNEPGREDNTARIARIVPLCRDLRRLGSAQLDLCQTASGTFDAYWEMYLQPYDIAAGSLIVQEAGGQVSDLAGGARYVEQGHVLATNGRLHARLLEIVGGAPA